MIATSAHAPQEFDGHLQAAILVQEVVTAVSPPMSTPNPASILDPILSPLTSLQDEQVAMTLLAAGLCQVMGFDTVMLGNASR